jgi:muconate cycloisomerase
MTFEIRYIELTKRYPLAISRGVSAGGVNLFVLLSAGGCTGVGEMSATRLTGAGEAQDGEAPLRALVAAGANDMSISDAWARGRQLGVPACALAAYDMARWDLLAKQAGMPLYRMLGLSLPTVPTSITVGINPPAVIREQVPEMLTRTGCRFLKIKLGSPDGLDADRDRFAAAQDVAQSFGVGLRVDANGGWDLAGAQAMCRWLADRGVDYVEQPLHHDDDDSLPALFADRPLPLFADESCNTAPDVARLAGRVDGVNLKLMKCGGVTEALRIVATARAHKMQTMIGCMGESSISISAGAAITGLLDHVDLDSQLNLAPDPAIGATLVDGVVTPAQRPGHGGVLTDAAT